MTKEELLLLKPDKCDEALFKKAKKRWDRLAKPLDGLGRLEEVICRIASIQRKEEPDITKKALVIMCADNGVVAEGVSQTDKEVTADVAALMGHDKSSVGIMTASYPIDIITVDVGIDSHDRLEGVVCKKVAYGTGNIRHEAAMSEEQCLEAIFVGIDMIKQCADREYGMVVTGEMGIGNTTTSTALLCALTGITPKLLTGRGAGLSDEGLKRKIQVIEESLVFHGFEPCGCDISAQRAFDMLRKVGGLDIASIAGMFIGGAIYQIPVVIDGFISAVGALAAQCIVHGCSDYMIASHTGREKGTKEVLNRLGLKAVIDADMALGEGSGAVLMLPMLDMAMALYMHGTDFEETAIDQYQRF